MGDSQLCKVHIHTDFPGEIIEVSTQFGKASEIKITHLASSLGVDEKSLEVGTRKLITVANGPGLSELMRESGVGVIDAFNSRRVLAQEWVDATENAREVVLIPIDQQSLKSAQEAITAIRRAGVRVAVLSSRSPLQALSAISTHNEDADYDDEIVELDDEKAKEMIFDAAESIPMRDFPEMMDWMMVVISQVEEELGTIRYDSLYLRQKFGPDLEQMWMDEIGDIYND